jgi:hypothetical protein
VLTYAPTEYQCESRQKAISILVVLALIAVAVAGLTLLPKRYTVGQRLSQTTVFWNDREAFLFLAVNTTGRSRNFLQEKLAETKYGYLTVFFGAFSDFSKQEVVAYHPLRTGQLDRFALPEHTAACGSWGLADGQLQLSPRKAGITKDFGGTEKSLRFWARCQRRVCHRVQLLRPLRILLQMTLRATRRTKIPGCSPRRNAKSSRTRAGTISF